MVKVISLSNEAYEKLKNVKGDRSFSELVIDMHERLSSSKVYRKGEIMKFCGIWKDDDEWDKIAKILEEDRKKFKLREYKW